MHIHRPIFDEPRPTTGREYAFRMRQHLQDVEEWQRTMRDEEAEGWGIGQMWTMEHRDGRVARLPDVCPYDEIHKRAQRREKAWMRYYMKKRMETNNINNLKTEPEMKQKQDNKYDGCVLFNGKIDITIKGERKQLNVDYFGNELKKADPKREVIIMRKGVVEYRELETGYVLVTEEMEEKGTFGLRPTHTCTSYGVYPLSDVIAWGYADDGESYNGKQAENEFELIRKLPLYKNFKREMEDEQLCIKVQDKNGEIGMRVETPQGQMGAVVVASADYILPCMTSFQELIAKTPDIKEVHFFTQPTEWKEEE